MFRHRTLLAEREIQSPLEPQERFFKLQIFDRIKVKLSFINPLVGGPESTKVTVKGDFRRCRHNKEFARIGDPFSNSILFDAMTTTGVA